MPSIKLKNFKYGLDSRRFAVEAAPGTLVSLENAHINQGGEIEKRKAFVYTAFPADTFGAQATASGIVTFGSIADPGGWTAVSTAVGKTVYYQRIQHPAVLAGETYSAGSHAMTAVVFSEVFGTQVFCVATFADGNSFCYADGSLVDDFTAGMILSYLAGNNVKLAANIKTIIENATDFVVTQITLTVTGTANNGAGKVRLTLTPATTLPTGSTITVSGVTGTVEANGTHIVTYVDDTHVDLSSVNFVNAYTAGGIAVTSLLSVTTLTPLDFNIVPQATTAGDGNFANLVTVTAINEGVAGASAIGSFEITGGRAGGAATATFTRSGAISNGQTVTINGKVYTFLAVLVNVEGSVLLDTGADDALQNLVDAINHTGTAGTKYYSADSHPDVEAGPVSAGAFSIVAKIGGTAGNAFTLEETCTNANWSGATMAGGTDSGTENQISTVQVISPANVVVNLIPAAVDFVTNIPTTVAALVLAINNYTGTSGYTAVANGNKISIYSAVTANPQPNNYNIEVTCKGNVCIGVCSFKLVPGSAGLTMSTFTVNGVDVLGGAITLSGLTPPTITKFYSTLEAQINAGTVAGIAHGVIALAHADYVQISKRVTKSTEADQLVYATFPENTGGINFNITVNTPTSDLAVSLSRTSFAYTMTESLALGAPPQTNIPRVTAIASGGTGTYTYKWICLTNPLDVDSNAGYVFNNGPWWNLGMYAPDAIYATTRLLIVTYNPLNVDNSTWTFQWRCRVTDSAGNVVFSDIVSYALTYI